MQEAEQVSSLIGNIYDAALDPSTWPVVLQELTAFVGGCAGSLFWRDSVHLKGSAVYAFGIERIYEQLYFEKCIKFDPLNAAYLCIGIGEVVSNSKMIPHAEFIESRFYKEWVQPQGLIDNVLTVVDKSATGVACCCVFRHERDGFADDESRRRMGLLNAHIRRAVLIGKMMDLRTAEAASLADTLDGLAAGIFLVDTKARIVHANIAGEALLAAGQVLSRAGGRLVARDAQLNYTLHTLLAEATDGDDATSARSIAMPLAGLGDERYVAHILPLTSGARRRAGVAYGAAAALFVHKAVLNAPSPPEILAQAFQLTPAELRVLLAVVEVGGAPEAAEALGSAETTVRWHLRNLYEKTGTERQAELVKLVAGFANPFLPDHQGDRRATLAADRQPGRPAHSR